MFDLLNYMPKISIYIILFFLILLFLVALFIIWKPGYLLGYYSPGFFGWPVYSPWYGSGYSGLYGMIGYGGLYSYLWGNPFLYNQFVWGNMWPWSNIYRGLWSYPYARSLGELLLVVPPAGDPIFIDEYVAEEQIIATVAGFLDVPLSPEELIVLTDPILNVLSANPSLLPEFWALYPDLAVTSPDLYAAILLL